MPGPIHADGASIGDAIDKASGGYFAAGNSAAAKTINIDLNGPTQELVLSASAPTITIVGGTSLDARVFRLILKQDGVGSKLLPTFSPAADYGTAGAPTLTTAANKKDILTFIKIGSLLFCVDVVKGFS